MAGDSSAIRAGKAYVEAYLEDSSLVKGLRAAEEKMKTFGTSVMAVGGSLIGVGAGIVAPLFAAAKSFSDAGSELADASARTGITVETLSALSFAANQTGTDLGAVEGGIRKMQKALVAGSEENQAAQVTFASLGLSVEKLMAMTPDQQFERIARAIANIHDPTAKAGAAMQVFGKSGTALLPLIDDMDALTGQARELGLVMSSEDAASADALGDAMDSVTAVLGRTVQVVGASLAPMLTDMAETFAEVAKQAISWVDANREVVVIAFEVGAAIVAVGGVLVGIGATIYGLGAAAGVLASAIVTIGGVIGAILSPIGLTVAAVVGLTAAFFTMTETGGALLSWLGDQFGALYETAAESFGAIATALKAGDIALAGQILWATLKVEWLKGVGFLLSVWADWGTATMQVFSNVSFYLAGVMTDAWAGIQTSAANAFAFISTGWTNTVASLAVALIRVQALFSKAWEYIKSLFTGSDIEEALKGIDEQTEASVANVNEDKNAKIQAIEDSRAGKVGGIEQTRADSQQALKDQQQADIEARRKAAQDAIDANAAELQSAQDELTGYLGQSYMIDEYGDGESAASKLGDKMPEFSPDSLDQAFQEVKASVAGSFGTTGLAGLGVGSSIGDEQLKEQKKTNKELEDLNKKAAVGQLVFK